MKRGANKKDGSLKMGPNFLDEEERLGRAERRKGMRKRHPMPKNEET